MGFKFGHKKWLSLIWYDLYDKKCEYISLFPKYHPPFDEPHLSFKILASIYAPCYVYRADNIIYIQSFISMCMKTSIKV